MLINITQSSGLFSKIRSTAIYTVRTVTRLMKVVCLEISIELKCIIHVYILTDIYWLVSNENIEIEINMSIEYIVIDQDTFIMCLVKSVLPSIS